MNCPPYYKASLPACPTSIEVRANLTASTQYTWTVRDVRFDTLYVGQATTDANGTLTIPNATPFPIALFNAHAGSFELTVKENAQDCDLATMTFCNVSYTHVLFDFFLTQGTTPPAIIGCDC